MKDNKVKSLVIRILIIINVLIYILFLYMDILYRNMFISTNILKFTSIIFCFTIALLIGEDCLNEKDKALLQIGLLITVFADLCFLILDYYTLGIALFCVVQVIYYNRYKGYKSHKNYFRIVRFISALSLMMTIYGVLNLFNIKIDFLYVVSFFYAICLISSTTESIRAFRGNVYPYPNKHIIFWGMTFFMICDINIAISNLTREMTLSITTLSSLLVWIFYLPSQTLLSISGYQFKKRK